MFPKVSSEIKSLLIVSLGFMILDPSLNAFKNMQKTIVSSIADDRPGFNAEGYTLRGILNSVSCIALWFAPYLCQTIGARLSLIVTALGYVYYVGAHAIETEWAMYSGALVLGVAYATIVPPKTIYLVEGSKPENVTRNVGIFYCLQKVVQILCNIFVFFTFEGKKYINQTTRRTAIFGLMGVLVLAAVSFMFLPKTTRDRSKETTSSIVSTVKTTWKIIRDPSMLCMCLVLMYVGMQFTFGDAIYSPSIGFTLAFGGSVKELVPLCGISKCVGGLLGFMYSILLGNCVRSRSSTRRFFVLSAAFAEVVGYVIAVLILPDSASLGNTTDKGFLEPNVSLALLGALLFGFGDACMQASVYSFIGDHFRDSSGEANSLCFFIKDIFVALNFYWISHLGIRLQVIIQSVVAVLGVVACCFTEWVSSYYSRNKASVEKPTEKCSKNSEGL